MKKFIAMGLVLAMGLTLSACSTKEEAKTYEMVIGHSQPETNPRSISLEQFKADVEEKTKF